MKYRFALMLASAFAFVALADDAPVPAYQSPYSVKFSVPEKELIGDILAGKRVAPREHSAVAPEEWYADATRKRWGAWGPGGKHLAAPEGSETRSATWKRERVIAVALRYRGISYQHHHLPDWEPPKDWPWKEVGRGHNAKGIDCSNFTTFAYNVALGLKPTSAVGPQAELESVPGPGPGKTTKVEKIALPERYEDYPQLLRTGDLLFIHNDKNVVSHVVLWVGGIGEAKNGVPLVLDSTGAGRKDGEGRAIPDGVWLRPFTEDSWYHRSAVHALRLIPDAK